MSSYKLKSDISMSITSDASTVASGLQKIALTFVGLGLLCLLVAFAGVNTSLPLLITSLASLSLGTVGYAYEQYKNRPVGIKNNGLMFGSLTNKGALAWIAAIVITGFYVLLYWFPAILGLGAKGAANTGLVALFDPLSLALNGKPASQWFVYGTLYTVAILVMGYKFILKYRHNKYQIWRTLSVMFFQLGFAFLIPEILAGLNSDIAYFAKDMKNMWPLNYYFFEDWHLKGMLGGGNLGMFFFFLGLSMVFIISPILTFYYGKRWYCSWVCGCGGLAETAGDPFRHLSDKSLKAWQIERWVIYGVLTLVTLTTIAVLYTFFHQNPDGYLIGKGLFIGIVSAIFVGLGAFLYTNKSFMSETKPNVKAAIVGIATLSIVLLFVALFTGSDKVFFLSSYDLRAAYGFFIGAAFSGVVGVGFYPIMGSRVWCRFGCPMAALLGLQQKFFSRFRITTNGGQCISCGNCSTYCEMGIDVRWYAQRGQNIVRSSCVGCGICSAVCPRGVLKLENGPVDNRKVIHVRRDEVGIIENNVY